MPCIKIQVRFGMQRCLQSLQPPTGNPNYSHSGSTGPNRAPLARFPCPYCTAWLESWGGRTRHIIGTKACVAAEARDMENARVACEEARRLGIAFPLRIGVLLDDALDAFGLHSYEEVPFVRTDLPADPPAEGATALGGANANDAPTANADDAPMPDPSTPPCASSQAAAPPPAGEDATQPGVDERGSEGGRNERGGKDERDHGECREPIVEAFLDPRAGQPINNSRAELFDLRVHMRSVGRRGAFDDDKNDKRVAGHTSEELKGKTPWRNVGSLMKGIDKLPHGPDWKATKLGMGEGDDENIFVLYLRDVIGVLRELIGNPRFKKHMCYTPERHWMADDRQKRVYGEMWTGDWGWKMQELLKDAQATIAPLIVASDKTLLSIIGGDQQAYPVYLTIGNISKKVRRKARKHTTILIAYLPVEDFKDFDDAQREQLKGELMHRMMELVLELLKKAGKEGVEMYRADGRLRRVYPLLAAYVANYPKQTLMACTSQGRCPICKVTYQRRTQYKRKPGRRRRKLDLKALRAFIATGDLAELDERGLKPWWPFWAHLPRAEFSGCITPDLLHQIHKGIFKSHLVKWVTRILGDKVVNKQMSAMTRASRMRHFEKGISMVQKWTGRESKEMAMQFLPVVAELMTDDLVRLTCALLDHMYRAHAAQMTEDELEEMEEAWRKFHRLKPALVALGALKNAGSFNRILKLHMVLHWPQSIRELRTPDSYNTEAPEHLHIKYAKEPWRRSNRVNPLPQMITFIQRQEAIQIQRAHLDAYLALIRKELAAADGGGGERHDDEDEGSDDEDEWEDVGEGHEETPDADGVHYPSPQLAIAAPPSRFNYTANQIATEYKAPDLIPALTRYLESEVASANSRNRPNQSDRLRVPNLSPHHLFNVWHRFSLHHARLPFAPDKPPQRDVVRAKLLTRNAYGQISREAAFDTVLYHGPSAPTNNSHGLHCNYLPPSFFPLSQLTNASGYHAARVLVIFTPPSNTHHLYPEKHLAYIEFFNPFSRTNNTPHGLHTMSTAVQASGRRQVAVVPISHLHMACHIAPRFKRVDPEIRLNRRTGLLAVARHFFYNHYSSHYNYKLFVHWRKRAPRP
ncbi:hypothetical protein FRC07_010971 [Ceratobasidium sp. 392]|nr:hypothetical protein FRC07_010971 [Ceratobasidium sp. 392]